VTAAVALVDGVDVVIGIDSCTTFVGGCSIDNAEKGLTEPIPGLLVATAGPNAFATELASGRWAPPAPADSDPVAFVRRCAASLRDHFTAEPLWTLSKDDDGELKGHFLVAWRGVAVEISSDFGLVRPRNGEMAIGSGRDFALGALGATRGLPPEARVHIALEAAAEYQQDVAGPFTIRRCSSPTGALVAPAPTATPAVPAPIDEILDFINCLEPQELEQRALRLGGGLGGPSTSECFLGALSAMAREYADAR
jgi:hypothetical protein